MFNITDDLQALLLQKYSPIFVQINIKFREYSFQKGPVVTVRATSEQQSIRDEFQIFPQRSGEGNRPR